jgi:hypothetical protein
MILTTEQLNVLNYVVVDGQAWADNANEQSILAKVEKYRQSYLDAQGDGYQTRKQRDDAGRQLRTDEYNNAPYNVKRSREYPHITDQLDMLYWDKINETEIWKNSITKIKAKHPKE